jgi:hypothetical protein
MPLDISVHFGHPHLVHSIAWQGPLHLIRTILTPPEIFSLLTPWFNSTGRYLILAASFPVHRKSQKGALATTVYDAVE